MKSIYSKLIFGFFITIVASFSVAGFVSLRLNDQQIESTVEEDLITTNDYVSKVISNINIENRDDIIGQSHQVGKDEAACQTERNRKQYSQW